jgi:hypothetical protein
MLAPLKPIAMKERVSLIFNERGEIDVLGVPRPRGINLLQTGSGRATERPAPRSAVAKLAEPLSRSALQGIPCNQSASMPGIGTKPGSRLMRCTHACTAG